MNKNSQARIKANNKYVEKTYARITLRVRKGRETEIKAYAESKGLSLNAYINQLIDNDMMNSNKE